MSKIYLIRHGETEWTLSGQHTSHSDISLTHNGEKQARLLAKRLENHEFEKIYVSPLKRAFTTCEIAGLSDRAIVDPKLIEWNYGDYEGITSKQIHETNPSWNIFLNGAPNGESVKDIEKRAAAFWHQVQDTTGDIAIFSHGHFLRALALRYIDLPLSNGVHFLLFPASVGILTHEKRAAIALWNDISHLSRLCTFL